MNRRQFISTAALTAILSPRFINSKLLSQTDTDKQIFDDIITEAHRLKLQDLEIGECVAEVGKLFVGKPYVGGLLDQNPEKEACVVNLQGFDCVTFFETSLCIARLLKKNKSNFEDLFSEITFTRYRDGILDGYVSRLHYTSDWFFDNYKKRVVKYITHEIGGVEIKFNINYMSQNWTQYKPLVLDKKLIPKIEDIERRLTKMKQFYINKDRIDNHVKYLRSGDIIGIVTNKKGLDYSHTGLIYIDENSAPRFLHASSKYKKVTLDRHISDYIDGVSSNLGITVVRPII